MRKCFFLLSSSVFAILLQLQGLEISQEDSLYIETLENGVTVWLQESRESPAELSLKVIWKTDEEVTSTSLNCLYGDDDIYEFFEYSKEDKDLFPRDIGIIVVGDFDKNQMRALIKEQFRDVRTWAGEKNRSPIEINPLEDNKVPHLTLSYPTPIQSAKTDEDLKNQWAIYFLQKLVQEEFKESLKESGGIWVEPAEVSYLPSAERYLPQTACIAKVYSNSQDLEVVLIGLLKSVQAIKKNGFSDEKFKEFKTESYRNLRSMSRNSPENDDLGKYYTDQFVSGLKCPSYSSFIKTSEKIIADMTLRDIHLLVDQFLKDGNRLVTASGITESKVRESFERFGADSVFLVIEDEEQDNRGKRGFNYALAYSQLPLTEEEAETIGDIIETVGNTYWAALGLKQWSLRDKEKKIKHVHPLRFLGEIFSNADLKLCMRKIRKSDLKWDGFMKGLIPNMEEVKERNLLQHIGGFCKVVGADPEKVRGFVKKSNWAGLVEYLIEN
jgi:predicted transcriptional regulator YheO